MLLSLKRLVNTAANEHSATLTDISKTICDLSAIQQRLTTMHACLSP